VVGQELRRLLAIALRALDGVGQRLLAGLHGAQHGGKGVLLQDPEEDQEDHERPEHQVDLEAHEAAAGRTGFCGCGEEREDHRKNEFDCLTV
jgi:hypothetical protein